jgi:hypothetical protein
MINRNRIKIVIAVLFIAGLSVALYMRQPKDAWESKWDKGYFDSAERLYYYNHINAIINKWKEAGRKAIEKSDSQSGDSLRNLLVIDLDKKAVWLEENGRISEYDYIEVAPATNWILYYYSTKSASLQKGRIILKNLDDKTALKKSEQLLLHVFGTKGSLGFTIIDNSNQLRAQGLYVSFSGPGATATKVDDIQSPFIVTNDEYQKYINSLKESNIMQSDKVNATAQEISVLEKNKAAWKRIEKKVTIHSNSG